MENYNGLISEVHLLTSLLLVHLGLGGPRAQVPSASALVVALVLDGDFAEMSKDVLHLGIAAATALAAEVVEPVDLVHEVVDDSNDDLDVQKTLAHDLNTQPNVGTVNHLR